MSAESILIIFLSAALLILLVMAIIVVAIFIQILRKVRTISNRAESVTGNVADLVAMVGTKVAPVALSAAVAAALRRLKK